jgi:pseudoazurin
MNMRKVMMLAAFAVLMSASMTLAAEVEVKMLNKGAEGLMVFEPALVKIEPGDTVKFVASDKSHNAESVKNMLPEGAAPFAGKMSEDVAVTFDKSGVYGVKCMPHYAMGMVALVVVGKADNLDQAKAVPQTGKAKQVFAALFERLTQQAAAK